MNRLEFLELSAEHALLAAPWVELRPIHLRVRVVHFGRSTCHAISGRGD